MGSFSETLFLEFTFLPQMSVSFDGRLSQTDRYEAVGLLPASHSGQAELCQVNVPLLPSTELFVCISSSTC